MNKQGRREGSLFLVRHAPRGATASSFTKFLDHTQRRTTVGTTQTYALDRAATGTGEG